MKAIVVKYLPPTNFKGARLKAEAYGWKAKTVGYQYDDFEREADAFAKQYMAANTNPRDNKALVGGTLPNGDRVYIIVSTKGVETV